MTIAVMSLIACDSVTPPLTAICTLVPTTETVSVVGDPFAVSVTVHGPGAEKVAA